MKTKAPAGLVAAGVLAFGVAASAQGGAQTPPSATREAAAKEVTVAGCVQREADYRRARDSGKGGVAGTGVGAGNEFVLADASLSAGGGSGATGTSGAAAMAYELTGPNEGKVSEFVGRRVEITGTLKGAETTASGRPTGGATAGQPPSGVDVTSKDLKLRELEVSSVREAKGTCPAAK
jgi:hypothetical protein